MQLGAPEPEDDGQKKRCRKGGDEVSTRPESSRIDK